MPTILVSGIEFYGYHGVSEAERAVGHRFTVDVEIECEAKATETDALADTIDYGAVALQVVEVGQGASCKTVERLAQLMGEVILRSHPSAVEVTVEVLKLLPPVAVIVNEAGVRLTLGRK